MTNSELKIVLGNCIKWLESELVRLEQSRKEKTELIERIKKHIANEKLIAQASQQTPEEIQREITESPKGK